MSGSLIDIWAFDTTQQRCKQARWREMMLPLTITESVPGVADVAIVDDQAAAVGVGQQAPHRGQAGVLLPEAVLVGAVHLQAGWTTEFNETQ